MGLKSLPKVTPLHLAQVRLPEGHPAATFGSSVAVYGFAIGHPDGTILVDTGVGYGSAVIDDLYQPERSKLDECLVQLGVDRDNVIAVVNSHLHFDHCGQKPAAARPCNALLLASRRNRCCLRRSVLHRRQLGDCADITATGGPRR